MNTNPLLHHPHLYEICKVMRMSDTPIVQSLLNHYSNVLYVYFRRPEGVPWSLWRAVRQERHWGDRAAILSNHASHMFRHCDRHRLTNPPISLPRYVLRHCSGGLFYIYSFFLPQHKLGKYRNLNGILLNIKSAMVELFTHMGIMNFRLRWRVCNDSLSELCNFFFFERKKNFKKILKRPHRFTLKWLVNII